MKRIARAFVVSTLTLALGGSIAFAQDHQNDQRSRDQHDQHYSDQHDHYVRHDDWRRGGHIRHEDWDRGREVDWRSRHLRQPPRGYEWREVDGNYVLAAVATGLISSVIIASSQPH